MSGIGLKEKPEERRETPGRPTKIIPAFWQGGLWNWAYQGEERRYIHEWFRGLPVGKSRTLVLQLGEKAEVTTSVTAKRLKDDSLIIVAYNSTLRSSP